MVEQRDQHRRHAAGEVRALGLDQREDQRRVEAGGSTSVPAKASEPSTLIAQPAAW